MFELLDNRRMAVKYGKWRGLAIACWALAPLALAYGAVKLQDLLLAFMPIGTQTGIPPLAWAAMGMIMLTMVLMLWALWQSHRDHVHGDHYMDAEYYRDHGW